MRYTRISADCHIDHPWIPPEASRTKRCGQNGSVPAPAPRTCHPPADRNFQESQVSSARLARP